VERLLEGDSVKRRRQDQGTWTSELVFKKTFKWAAFLAISLAISHSFLAYFVGTEGLAAMMASSPAQSPVAFGFMALMTATVLFDFGWFREQFCTLICPYGRFQSVLMDEESLAVSYDLARGEPRGISRLKTGGDCVDCRRCVQVCPTGIDIRNGLQLECVACTACIDACDHVMERLKRPKGLIRYTGIKGLRALLRPRVLALAGALSLFLAGLAWTLSAREVLDVTLARATGEPYSLIDAADGRKTVANRFRNQSWEEARVSIRPVGDGDLQLIATAFPLTLSAGKAQRLELFMTFSQERVAGGTGKATLELKVEVFKLGQTHFIQREVPLVGPL
jgi:cytochrome c oxidase accessory protein FixG